MYRLEISVKFDRFRFEQYNRTIFRISLNVDVYFRVSRNGTVAGISLGILPRETKVEIHFDPRKQLKIATGCFSFI